MKKAPAANEKSGTIKKEMRLMRKEKMLRGDI